MTRKILAAGIAALALSSCSTITHTSQTAPIDTQIYNLTVADMKVAAKKDSVTVDWKWNPLSTVSLKAQKETATHTLLGKNDADVLVEPQYIVHRRGIFRGGSVTVTGYPATYSDFRAMTADYAEKIATVNGDCATVVISPVMSTSTAKVKKRTPKPQQLPFRSKSEPRTRHFINVLGGPVVHINGLDVGINGALMYGCYGSSWGWYGKFAMNTCELYAGKYDSYERKWTPTLTVGAIKTIGSSWSAFFGVGAGGYFTEKDDSYYTEVTKFTIPVEIGFMKRFHKINVTAGATYATPLYSGAGSITPFLGVGYSF